jgi:hypothetical protein
MTVQRRLRTHNAAARATPKPTVASVKQSVVKGTAHTSAVYGRKQRGTAEVYSETDGQEDILEETFPEDDPPAFVKMSAGITHNLGNYEFLRLDCSVTLPVHRSKLDKGMEYASQFVADKIADEEHNWLGKSTRGGK